MEHVIQVEIRSDTTHTLTWLDAALKPKPDMVLLHKDDHRSWTVVHAYITAQEMRVNDSDWKLGDDAASLASKKMELRRRTNSNA